MENVENLEKIEKLNGIKKRVGAKVLSKMSMVFSSIWIASLTILLGLKKIDLSMNDIILSGVAITGVWTPTFISIITDKFRGEK